jgi:hypothetical protein
MAGTFPPSLWEMMQSDNWKEQARCLDYDTNLFFDTYEEDETLRVGIDNLCAGCPVARLCFATGVSQKAWGVWGGVYLENGKISREFNKHRSKADWAETWKNLTND